MSTMLVPGVHGVGVKIHSDDGAVVFGVAHDVSLKRTGEHELTVIDGALLVDHDVHTDAIRERRPGVGVSFAHNVTVSSTLSAVNVNVTGCDGGSSGDDGGGSVDVCALQRQVADLKQQLAASSGGGSGAGPVSQYFECRQHEGHWASRNDAVVVYAESFMGNIIVAGGANRPCSSGNRCGEVYVFVRTAADQPFVNVQNFQRPAGVAKHKSFGTSAQLMRTSDGAQWMAVLAREDNGDGSTAPFGRLYMYKWETNQMVLKQQIGNAFNVNTFQSNGTPRNCAAHGDSVVCGNPSGFSNRGYIFVVVRASATAFSFQQRINSPYTANYQLGERVTICVDTLAVWRLDRYHGFQGAVLIYLRTGSTWAQQQVLLDPEPADKRNFGSALQLSDGGNYLAVGVTTVTDTVTDVVQSRANIYLYKRVTAVWSLHQTLLPLDHMYGPFRFTLSYPFLYLSAYTAGGGEVEVWVDNGTWYKQETIADPGSYPGENFGERLVVNQEQVNELAYSGSTTSYGYGQVRGRDQFPTTRTCPFGIFRRMCNGRHDPASVCTVE